MGKKNRYTNIKVHKDLRKTILIDDGLHQRLKLLAVAEKTTIKSLIEESLQELLAIKSSEQKDK